MVYMHMPPYRNERRSKRANMPLLSPRGQHALDQFGRQLRETEDLRPATVRNYVSDVRHFVAWCETRWREETQEVNEELAEELAMVLFRLPRSPRQRSPPIARIS